MQITKQICREFASRMPRLSALGRAINIILDDVLNRKPSFMTIFLFFVFYFISNNFIISYRLSNDWLDCILINLWRSNQWLRTLIMDIIQTNDQPSICNFNVVFVITIDLDDVTARIPPYVIASTLIRDCFESRSLLTNNFVHGSTFDIDTQCDCLHEAHLRGIKDRRRRIHFFKLK